MIKKKQIPTRYRQVIEEQNKLYDKGRTVQVHKRIPDTTQIPLAAKKHWFRIPDVICVYVDMVGSTKLSASKNDKGTAGAYQLFTGTAVRLFHEFEAPYIDVRGDGVFALFNFDQPYRALASAITFNTFTREVFISKIKNNAQSVIGCHIGIDQKTVLVRKIGLKRKEGRTDRQNEVWAGRPINMASKLASEAKAGQIFVSDRFYSNLKNDLVKKPCECTTNSKNQWKKINLTNNKNFDFEFAYLTKSQWCEKHGASYCEKILALDSE